MRATHTLVACLAILLGFGSCVGTARRPPRPRATGSPTVEGARAIASCPLEAHLPPLAPSAGERLAILAVSTQLVVGSPEMWTNGQVHLLDPRSGASPSLVLRPCHPVQQWWTYVDGRWRVEGPLAEAPSTHLGFSITWPERPTGDAERRIVYETAGGESAISSVAPAAGRFVATLREGWTGGNYHELGDAGVIAWRESGTNAAGGHIAFRSLSEPSERARHVAAQPGTIRLEPSGPGWQCGKHAVYRPTTRADGTFVLRQLLLYRVELASCLQTMARFGSRSTRTRSSTCACCLTRSSENRTS